MGRKTKTIIMDLGILLLIITGVVMVFILRDKIKAREVYNHVEDSKLVIYEGPKSLKDAAEEDLEATSENQRDFSLMHCVDTSVSVNGKELYVYDTNVNNTHSWADNYLPPVSRTPITYFDFEGTVLVEITVPDINIDKVKISPQKYGIRPEVDKDGHKITFPISEPDTYTVVFNDSVERAIHIFGNPLEENPPKEGDEDVIYIGPGEWDIENIPLEENQTLYIAGGAVVHGTIQGNYVNNVTVKGRGILDGSLFEGWQGKTANVPINFTGCRNINVEDVIFLNSNAWVFNSFESKDAKIHNIKIISPRPNGDGITLQSCENFLVEDSFVRSFDDSLAVKNYGADTNNITFKNIQVWTDLAQSMEIGYETNKGNKENARISNIAFEDITVLYNFHKPVISIHNGDDALVEDILFKNITVENALMGSGDAGENNQLIDLGIMSNGNWSTTKERGQIKNVTIDGVNVISGKFPPSKIAGFDETHTIEDVTIKNLNILGKSIKDPESGKFEIDKKTTKNIIIE